VALEEKEQLIQRRLRQLEQAQHAPDAPPPPQDASVFDHLVQFLGGTACGAASPLPARADADRAAAPHSHSPPRGRSRTPAPSRAQLDAVRRSRSCSLLPSVQGMSSPFLSPTSPSASTGSQTEPQPGRAAVAQQPRSQQRRVLYDSESSEGTAEEELDELDWVEEEEESEQQSEESGEASEAADDFDAAGLPLELRDAQRELARVQLAESSRVASRAVSRASRRDAAEELTFRQGRVDGFGETPTRLPPLRSAAGGRR